jgi:hypothetical protein
MTQRAKNVLKTLARAGFDSDPSVAEHLSMFMNNKHTSWKPTWEVLRQELRRGRVKLLLAGGEFILRMRRKAVVT